MSIRSVFAGTPFCVSATPFIYKYLALPLKMSIWRFIVDVVRGDIYRLVQCTTVHWDVGRAIGVQSGMGVFPDIIRKNALEGFLRIKNLNTDLHTPSKWM